MTGFLGGFAFEKLGSHRSNRYRGLAAKSLERSAVYHPLPILFSEFDPHPHHVPTLRRADRSHGVRIGDFTLILGIRECFADVRFKLAHATTVIALKFSDKPSRQKKEPGSEFLRSRADTWRRPTLTGPIVPLPLALRRFTSGFGMGPGGSTALWSPEGNFGVPRLEPPGVKTESLGN